MGRGIYFIFMERGKEPWLTIGDLLIIHYDQPTAQPPAANYMVS